jgi:cell division transport system permease protein
MTATYFLMRERSALITDAQSPDGCLKFPMNIWLVNHGRALRIALRRLIAAPLITLLSLLAIGVALALPAGGQMLLNNVQRLMGSTSATPQISVFMATDAGRGAATELGARLKKHPAVKQQRFLPREDTLQRMKANAGLREVIDVLPNNPFPDAFIVTAIDDQPATLDLLVEEFRQWPKVAHVQLDSAWARRLEALLRLGRNAVTLLGGLLATGLIAITFNIIRMQVLTHRAEIEVSQLLGATNGFICRPFLYFGALLGFAGGATAWLLIAAAAWWLRTPLDELLHLYEFTYSLQSLSLADAALLLGIATGLGWLGALLSLGQHLRHS